MTEKVTTTVRSIATRYRCPLQVTAQCWGDKSKRASCPGCGARLHTLTGLWGVFTWRGDGRYRAEDAHRTYVRKSAADAATKTDQTWVVRWITSSLI